MKKLLLFFTVFCSFLGHSFSQEISDEVIKQNRKTFSLTLAKALEQPEFRNYIKEKSLSSADGKYGFAYQCMKNDEFLGQNVSGYLGSIAVESNISIGEDFFNQISLNDPYLSMSVIMPMEGSLPSDWNTEQTPSVVVESENNKFEMIDSRGEVRELRDDDEIREPIIVIEESTSLIGVDLRTELTINGNNVFNLILGDIDDIDKEKALNLIRESVVCDFEKDGKTYTMINKSRVFEGYFASTREGSEGNSEKVTAGDCPRDTKNNTEEIVSFRLKGGWSSWKFLRDGIANNKIELFVLCKRFMLNSNFPNDYTKGAVVVTKHPLGSFHKNTLLNCSGVCTGKTITLPGTGMGTFNWNRALNGDEVQYEWWEEDKGDPIEITQKVTVKFKGIEISKEVKIKYDPTQDDLIGTAIVDYCNPNGLTGATHDAGAHLESVVREKN